MPEINYSSTLEYLVPVPPIDIQHKIVTVLDNFDAICSDLQIGLPAEINARQKQYEYYRDQLLGFAATGKPVISVSESNRGGVELIKLSQYVFGYALVPMAFLFDFRSSGLYRSKNDIDVGGISYIRYLDAIDKRSLYVDDINSKTECTEKELRQFSAKYGDVFFTERGNVGKSSVLLAKIDKCIYGANLMRARPKTDLLLPEYSAYCFSTHEFERYIVFNRKKAVIELLLAGDLAGYLLPIPSIATQQKIAAMLDLFQEMQTGTISGIQAEIDLRVKQYEYYRDFLLQFD